MKLRINKLIIGLLAFCCSLGLSAQETVKEVQEFNKITWNTESVPKLPAGKGQEVQAGLAGAYSGVITIKDEKGEDKQVMIMAGGANFSKKPLVDALKEGVPSEKIYHKDIFVLAKKGDKYEWTIAETQLPNAAAYGASFVYDNTILLVGGEVVTETGKIVSDKIQQLTYKDGKIEVKDFTTMPVSFTKGGGVLDGDKIYLVAGKQNGEASNDVHVYDIKAKKWSKELPYPGPARLEPVVAAQSGGFKGRAKLYVFSGFTTVEGKTIALTDGYAFLPKKGDKPAVWAKTSDVIPHGSKEGISLLGASSAKIGLHTILFFGGYNKTTWDNWLATYNSVKGTPAEQAAKVKFFSQTPEAMNWNKEVLAYNTVTNTFISLGEVPFLPNCGAVVQKMNGDYIVTNGEVMPGVRTNTAKIASFKYEPAFGTINWVVLVLYFLGMIYLGYYFMQRENGADDFMTGGGRIPWWAAGVSIFATMLSSISFIAIPAMTYTDDWKVFFAAVMIVACVPVICSLYLPFFRRLKLTSAYEYLEARFNNASRSLSSIIFILYMIGRIGIVLFLPSIALSAVTGIDVTTCIIVIGIITILYCMMGGIEAVIWGDFIQGIVLVGGAILAAVYLAMGTGGEGVTATAEAADKFTILDFAFDPSRPTFWVILIGGFFTNLASYTSDQSVVQRYLTTADEAGAKKSLWLNGILAIPVSAVFYFIGTTLYTFYSTNPESMNVAIESKNQIFPHFMMSELPVGLAGLLIAAVFSATMSTLSSNINSAATAYVTDFYKRFNSEKTDHQCLNMARILTVIVGVLGIAIAIVVANMDVDIFIFFNQVSGMFLSGLGALFAMGIFTKRISGKAAFIALLINAAAMFYLKENYKLHGFVWGFVGMFTTFIVGYVLSFIFPQTNDIDGLTIYTINNIQTLHEGGAFHEGEVVKED